MSEHPDYREYMESRAWRRKRHEFWRSHPHECRKCGTRKRIHLHHHTYERFGREMLCDLVALCAEHHDELHQQFPGGDLTAFTAQFLGLSVEDLRANPLKPPKPPKPKRVRIPEVRVGKKDPLARLYSDNREEKLLGGLLASNSLTGVTRVTVSGRR